MPIDRIADGADLAELRKTLGYNQAEMAVRMGLGARAYFSLEQNPSSVNVRHIMLAEHVALTEAAKRGDRSFVPLEFAAVADKVAKIKPARR